MASQRSSTHPRPHAHAHSHTQHAHRPYRWGPGLSGPASDSALDLDEGCRCWRRRSQESAARSDEYAREEAPARRGGADSSRPDLRAHRAWAMDESRSRRAVPRSGAFVARAEAAASVSRTKHCDGHCAHRSHHGRVGRRRGERGLLLLLRVVERAAADAARVPPRRRLAPARAHAAASAEHPWPSRAAAAGPPPPRRPRPRPGSALMKEASTAAPAVVVPPSLRRRSGVRRVLSTARDALVMLGTLRCTRAASAAAAFYRDGRSA